MHTEQPEKSVKGISRRDLILNAPLGLAAGSILAASPLGTSGAANAQIRQRQPAAMQSGHTPGIWQIKCRRCGPPEQAEVALVASLQVVDVRLNTDN